MFTLADIRNIAVQIEQNGAATYRQAAECAANPELAQMFSWMADEERRHGELFATIIPEKTLSDEQAELEAMGRALLQDIVRSQTFSLQQQNLEQAASLEELLAQSIEFEQDTIQFYEFLAAFLENEEALGQLHNIIAQERKHVQQLVELRSIGHCDAVVPGRQS